MGRKPLFLGVLLSATVISAAASAGEEAPEPRRKAALNQVAMVYPAGPAGAGAQLNRMFDASRNYPALAVPAPQPREQAGSPNKKLETLYSRPAVSSLHQQLVVPVPKETPAYRRTFRAMLANPDTTDRWDETILRYARIFKLDSRLLKSIMAAESEFKPEALSPAGARGLMQVMPKTSEGVGVPASKLHDPKWGIKAGAAYIQVLFKAAWRIFNLKGVRYTDAPMWVVQRVIAAYHAGPGFLTKRLLYPSTRAYVRKVVLFYHSKVTDLRRPSGIKTELPAYGDTVAQSGAMY